MNQVAWPLDCGFPSGQPRVAPTFVLKYNIRTRSLADPGVIEDVLAVENDVVPFDRADVLEQGCVTSCSTIIDYTIFWIL